MYAYYAHGLLHTLQEEHALLTDHKQLYSGCLWENFILDLEKSDWYLKMFSDRQPLQSYLQISHKTCSSNLDVALCCLQDNRVFHDNKLWQICQNCRWLRFKINKIDNRVWLVVCKESHMNTFPCNENPHLLNWPIHLLCHHVSNFFPNGLDSSRVIFLPPPTEWRKLFSHVIITHDALDPTVKQSSPHLTQPSPHMKLEDSRHLVATAGGLWIPYEHWYLVAVESSYGQRKRAVCVPLECFLVEFVYLVDSFPLHNTLKDTF